MSLLSLDDREFMDLVKVFLRDNYKDEIKSILSESDETAHYFVTIGGEDVMTYCIEIFQRVCESPLTTFKLLDRCMYTIQKEIYEEIGKTKDLTLKENIHGRIVQFPQLCELLKPTLPRVKETNKFLIVNGTVIRTTPVKLLEYKRDFQCPKCKFVFEVQADIQRYFKLDKPKICPNPMGCNGTKFRSLDDLSGEPTWCRDVQEVKIQEKLQHLSVGKMPRSMWVVLYDDLVDICKPGNDVQISGIVMQRWKPLVIGARPDIELILFAHNVEISNRASVSSVSSENIKEFRKFWVDHRTRPLEGRDKIIASVCPQIYGLYLVKLSLALVLTGGKQRVDDCGTKVRGESHLLLIGDPGTAKSQFLKFAAKVSPRSVLTTGIGSTSAGLTVAAVKEGGEWQLEAGALVLADGGVCCIDEFNSMAEKDRACIHEAMEQQTLSVAKAGMVCKLSTECSVIAATNPKESRLNLNHSIMVNTSIASPLLSRFDIVLILEDKRSKEWDGFVSSHILTRRTISAPKVTGHWNIDKLRQYFCFIKSIEPAMSDDARTVVLKYYQFLRNSDSSNVARTTVRMLDSLMRLVQAHARLMYCDTVYVRDAITVIRVMESSLQGSVLMQQSSNTLCTTFPDDPDKEYLTKAEIILTKLDLLDVLERERKRLNDNQNGLQIFKIHDDDWVTSQDEFKSSTQLSSKTAGGKGKFTRIENREVELPSRIEKESPAHITKPVLKSAANTNLNILGSLLGSESDSDHTLDDFPGVVNKTKTIGIVPQKKTPPNKKPVFNLDDSTSPKSPSNGNIATKKTVGNSGFNNRKKPVFNLDDSTSPETSPKTIASKKSTTKTTSKDSNSNGNIATKKTIGNSGFKNRNKPVFNLDDSTSPETSPKTIASKNSTTCTTKTTSKDSNSKTPKTRPKSTAKKNLPSAIDTKDASTSHLASMLQSFAYKRKQKTPPGTSTKTPLVSVNPPETLKPVQNGTNNDDLPKSPENATTPKELVADKISPRLTPFSEKTPVSATTKSKLQIFAFRERDVEPEVSTPKIPKNSQPIKRNAFVLNSDSSDEDLSFLDGVLNSGQSSKKFKL